MTGTRVQATDVDTGETEEIVITDNYVIITDGTCHIASQSVYANGTVQITIKGRA